VLTWLEAPPLGDLRLLLQGREYRLYPRPVASGERYATEQGRRDDWSMEWRGKGRQAELMEAPLSDSRKPEDLQTFLRCKAV
jgi:hypothetical protein